MRKGQKPPPMIYLNPGEYMAIQMGLGAILEDMETVTKDPRIPFTPEIRNQMAEIMRDARSAALKIKKITGVDAILPPYRPGDENEFLTKES